MDAITDHVTVRAPASRVWRAIEDPAEHAEWHPFVTRIDGPHALGETRRCDVLVGRRTGATVERCVRYDDGREIVWRIDRDDTGFSSMVSDWTAGFLVEPLGPHETRVTAVSTFAPKRLVTRLMLPLIRRKFHDTQRRILDDLRRHTES